VTGGLAFGTVSAGQDHTCGVTRGPAAYCWGDNQVGQLGAGTSTGPELCSFGTACSTQPVAVVRASNVAAISAGGRHTCALAPVGAAFCWGWNLDGQLGTGRRAPDFCDPGGGPTPCSPRPVPVVGRLTFAGVSAGFSHTCGVTPAGVAYCWGFNLSGQLGIGENVPSWPRPVQVAAP
jgi:alpha-tubulin suppressor-like RCC1 family protein